MAAKEDLRRLISSGDYILFAGAGVSIEAGIPSWEKALDQLADSLQAADEACSAAMRSLSSRGRYLEAAEQLYLADCTQTDRAAWFRQVFDREYTITPRLRRLISIPNTGIVTTNYDKVLLSAASREGVELEFFTESDADLAASRLSENRYLVRLHGRVESPETLIIARRHYEALRTNDAYASFFTGIFEHQNVVFFGFSFDDPHLKALIETSTTAARGLFGRAAYALFPSEPSSALRDVLNRAAIIPVIYDPSDDHNEGWKIVSTSPRTPGPSPRSHAEHTVRTHLAAILAHLRLRDDASMKTQVLAALSLSPIEAECRKRPLTAEESVEVASSALGLIRAQAPTVRTAIRYLIDTGALAVQSNQIFSSNPRSEPATDDLDILVEGVTQRVWIRYRRALSKTPILSTAIRDTITQLLIADGLHVAYNLVKHKPVDADRLEKALNGLLGENLGDGIDADYLRRAILHLLTRPDAREEALLDKLAGVAFSACTLLTEPFALQIAERISGRRIFLDASVVLPWMSDGHPAQDLYDRIISGLPQGTPCIAEFYLNELVSHRHLAVEEYEYGHFKDPDRLKRFSMYVGLQGLNAFIAGYTSSVGKRSDEPFDAYLNRVAPFQTESEASHFLESKGIAVVAESDMIGPKDNVGLLRSVIREGLQEAGKRRERILIEHDAKMMEFLRRRNLGQRPPYFLTADKALIRLVSKSRVNEVLQLLLLPYQAAYVADLAGRSKGLLSGLSRTLWTIRTEPAERIREFYIDRILAEYEPALVEEMDELIEQIEDEIAQAEETFGSIDALVDDHGRQSVKEFLALDRFEAGFYQKMSEALRKHRG